MDDSRFGMEKKKLKKFALTEGYRGTIWLSIDTSESILSEHYLIHIGRKGRINVHSASAFWLSDEKSRWEHQKHIAFMLNGHAIHPQRHIHRRKREEAREKRLKNIIHSTNDRPNLKKAQEFAFLKRDLRHIDIKNQVPLSMRRENLPETTSHGSGNSKCAIKDRKMIELNNEKIDDHDIFGFLKFIGYTRKLDIQFRKPVKRNWGKSSTLERWIRLRRHSIWVFLHELAHQFVPMRMELLMFKNEIKTLEEINPPAIGKISSYRFMLPEKSLKEYTKYQLHKHPYLQPHGHLFGEILTHLVIAWESYRGRLEAPKWQHSLFRRDAFQYERAIQIWMGIDKPEDPKPRKGKKGNKRVVARVAGIPFIGPESPDEGDDPHPPKKSPRNRNGVAQSGKISVKAIAYTIWLDDPGADLELIQQFIGERCKIASLKRFHAAWRNGTHIPRIKKEWDLDQVLADFKVLEKPPVKK
jgi:hypothetical protein